MVLIVSDIHIYLEFSIKKHETLTTILQFPLFMFTSIELIIDYCLK